MVSTARRISTTEMQVTSIRLETELKERLKGISGNQGYQSLIREILWDYVERQGQGQSRPLSATDIRATTPAIAQREERCAMTGATIAPGSAMLLGWTTAGQFLPLSQQSLV